MIYINLKSCYGVETVDQLSKKDFSSYKDFIKELKRLLYEYHLAGMAVYSSSRCTKDWKNK
jgi:hypothetical protein